MKINDEIIKRLMDSCCYKTKKALADAYGMTSQNFSNKQAAGTLGNIIITECLKHNVNINWVYTGIGEIYIPSKSITDISLISKSRSIREPDGRSYKKRDYDKNEELTSIINSVR